MNSLNYILRFFFRIRYWLIICPLIVGAFAFVVVKSKPFTYSSNTTIYTGIVSGYDIEIGDGTRQDWNIINNAMDNLINIITSETTLKKVSMRLYAQDLAYGDPEKDNKYMSAKSYNTLVSRTPKDVMALVVRGNDSLTLINLNKYEQADHDNHVYGMFRWHHPHYSYEALSRVKVKRIGNSDMLEVSYTNNDPGITYNTLEILNDEFRKQYEDLRFGQTNYVIKFFEQEEERLKKLIEKADDSLTQYNVNNRVINYEEQTKQIAAMTRDHELSYERIMLNYKGSEQLRNTIEEKVGSLEAFKHNTDFIRINGELSKLNEKQAFNDAFNPDSQHKSSSPVSLQIEEKKRELAQITSAISREQYTKEGIATTDMISQWLEATLLANKSEAELRVMEDRKKHLDSQYETFSPIGTTLNRIISNREFLRQSYMSILTALNAARLKQKNLQMSSATLKILNPPVLPLDAEPNKRKMIVVMAMAGAFLFILGFFFLLELLDRTLRDKTRTERITSGKVIGAFPAPGRLRLRRYSNLYKEIGTQFMSNAIMHYIKSNGPRVVNFLSTEPGDGKTFLTEQLADHLRSNGMDVRVVSWNKDFDIHSKEFLLAGNISDFIHTPEGETPIDKADLVLVEYPALRTCNVPYELLSNSALNVMVVRANRVWKDTDQLLFDKITEQSGDIPVALYLNKASRESVETFTGLMPPYSPLRKLGYKLYQFGFTAVDK